MIKNSRPGVVVLAHVFVVGLVLLAFAGIAAAQSGQFSGHVTDPQKAAVVNASVRVVNQSTAIERKTTTNSDGFYSVPFLNPGSYRVYATANGFETSVTKEVTLEVGQALIFDFQLTLGAMHTEVTVQGGQSMINETDSTVATIVDRQLVDNMPLNGRSFQELIALTPGVIQTVATKGGQGGQFSVDGQRTDANIFTVDGVSANVANGITQPGLSGGEYTGGNLPTLTTVGTTQSLVSVDAMQEFQVQTSTYSAEFGRSPGGQISIVSRGGSNAYHGTAFDYLRNEAFDANNWFSNNTIVAATTINGVAVPAHTVPRAPERQEDFGGVFGGPVRIPGLYNGKDRTFFFFSYEGQLIQTPTFMTGAYPSAALRQAAPAAIQPVLNAFPLPNSTTPLTSGFLTTALQAGNPFILANPNNLIDTYGFQAGSYSYSNPSTTNAYSLRLDHTVNSKLTLFGRFSNTPSSGTVRNPANLAGVTEISLWSRTLTLGATYLFSSNVVNDIRFNDSYNGGEQNLHLTPFGGAVPFNIGSLLPSSNIPAGQLGLVSISFTDISGNTGLDSINEQFNNLNQTQMELADNLSWVRGAHRFKFGVDYRRLTPVIQLRSYALSGGPSTLAQEENAGGWTENVIGNQEALPLFTNYSLYGEDTWKVSSRLTLDLGLRWDINPAPSSRNSTIPLTATGLSNLASATLAPIGTPLYPTKYTNFAPRIGGAYVLRKSNGWDTVLRGGFGIFYDTGNQAAGSAFDGFPYSSTASVTNVFLPYTSAATAARLVALPTGVPAGGISAIPKPYSTIFVAGAGFSDPYTRQWSVTVEQELGTKQSLTVSYVGNSGRNLLQTAQYNETGINTNGITFLQITTNNATSDYDAMQVQFQRRMSHGLQALVSYTWAHALDTDSQDEGGLIQPVRGNAAFDMRHNLSLAMTYQVPTPGKNALLNVIVGHWAVDTVFHAQTGVPIDLAGSTISNPPGFPGESISGRVSYVPGFPIWVACGVNGIAKCPGGKRLNPTADDLTAAQVAAAGCAAETATNQKGPFCTPATGTLGNFGRNVIHGFGLWQQDLAVRREFKLTEGLKMQFRAEAFNVYNHANFGAIQTSLTSATFGQATNLENAQLGGLNALFQVGGQRVMQFGLKFLF